MSKKANPTVIGLFIVSGVGVLLAGVVLFSSLKLFSKSWTNILYFDTSLNGLSEGAPVKYRGVTIGRVKKVMIHFNQRSDDYFMPVIIELEDKLLRERLDDPQIFRHGGDLDAAIQHGLRASLKAESIVTGVLYLELNTVSNAPPPVFHQVKRTYVEIPTHSTDISQLLENLGRVDFKGFESKLSELITNVSTALGTLKLGDMSAGVTNTLLSVQQAVTEYKRLAEKLNGRVDPLADSVTNTLAEASQTLAHLRAGVQSLGGMVSADSPLQRELHVALEQITDAAQSIAALADFLERNPNALITGRKKPDKKP
ncbi:MAG: phospholipid/cholesterol/gamma-HCH transport system substrate-binding protein [Verrucomicrobiota bacterium]